MASFPWDCNFHEEKDEVYIFLIFFLLWNFSNIIKVKGMACVCFFSSLSPPSSQCSAGAQWAFNKWFPKGYVLGVILNQTRVRYQWTWPRTCTQGMHSLVRKADSVWWFPGVGVSKWKLWWGHPIQSGEISQKKPLCWELEDAFALTWWEGRGNSIPEEGTSPHIGDEVEAQRRKETSPTSHSTLAFQLWPLGLGHGVQVSQSS